MWFICALLCMLFWGTADLFYKKGAGGPDKYSHLLTSVAVGVVMGAHAIVTLLFADFHYDSINLLIYAPVSAMYILSMTIGYLGLRYLELSVSSPIQNSSGAVVCLLCLIFLGQVMDVPTALAVVLIIAGTFLLGLFEKKEAPTAATAEDKKYITGFKAIMFPVVYCIIDALGTFFDAYYLDDFAATPLKGVTEDSLETVANVSYELTFLLIAILLFVYVVVIKKQAYRLKLQKHRYAAAVFETAGQFVYVYAMSGNAVVAAPMVAAYAMVSIILSRIFLKEKLSRSKYASAALVLAGIIILGILEGLAE